MGRLELEKEVAELLMAQGFTVSTAESCSGGLLGHRLTSVPGSSNYFLGGAIVYSNAMKNRVLGVGYDVLRREGAVSDRVARLMAIAVRGRFGAHIGISITGIAGPSGGSEEKPVGLVYIGLADSLKCRVCRFDFGSKQRSSIKRLSTTGALEMLRDFLRMKGETDNGQEEKRAE